MSQWPLIYHNVIPSRILLPLKFTIIYNWNFTFSHSQFIKKKRKKSCLIELYTLCGHDLIQAICFFQQPQRLGQCRAHILSSASHFAPVQSVPVDFMDQWIGFLWRKLNANIAALI